MSPEGNLFVYDNAYIHVVDPSNGFTNLYYTMPTGLPQTAGLVAAGGNIFYTMQDAVSGDDLYLIDVSANTVTNLGSTGFGGGQDMTLFNGEFYQTTPLPGGSWGVFRIDIANPSNSSLVVTESSPYHINTLTASKICNMLISTYYSTKELIYINLIDGVITPICDMPPEGTYITSMLEFQPTTICYNYLDLDNDDSSGAVEADYYANEVNCITSDAPVSDDDIGMLYEALITSMTIEVITPVPDDPLEILFSTGSVSNISISGDGTPMITLTNAGGAKSTDFKDALRLIRYQNNAESPTGGTRTVEVQFTTESGSESNVATAFIEVVELPLVPVDLGEDVQVCEGETATFDAGILGAEYEWSSGDDTQTITVDQSGEYIVTVADGENCPGIDTVVLDVLPVIDVSLSGDTEICDNEEATIIINTSTPFALDIDISSDPGSPFNFPNVTSTTPFNDLISDPTTYTITSVTPSQDACITLSDPEHEIDVYASFMHAFDVVICDDDSVWLGFYWETEAGVYENTFDSYFGCDSVVTTTIAIVPAIELSVQGTTCDSSEVGVFITTIDNPSGCDTTITTTITLAPADTTSTLAVTCILSQAGISYDTLTNLAGCDSVIITTTVYQPPADTTFTFATTCDSMLIGVNEVIVPAADGCDSLIVTAVTFAASDTTYVSGTSCDSAAIGVFQTLLQNSVGCDSLVITTVTAGMPDTTHTASTSCDSSSLGMFEHHFLNMAGCDSVVFHTISYSAVDSTFATGTTCNPSGAGVFVAQFVNQFGCDSIVTTTISLLPSDTISVAGTTCDPDMAGETVQSLQNIHGCDSIVTTTLSLLPSSATDLFETTCITSEAGVFVSTLINQYGCDSIVTLTVSLVDADTIRLDFMTCFEDEVGNTETLYTGTDGCDSLVVSATVLYPETFVTLATLYDYNGYDISCAGAEDGGIIANVVGTPPFTYLWSTGSHDHMITGLSSGNYELTITVVR